MYKNKKIEKICTDQTAAIKKHGSQTAVRIKQCVSIIRAADSVESLIRDRVRRCHALTQDRKGQYAMDLAQPYRLIFEVDGDEVQIACIIEITDYH